MGGVRDWRLGGKGGGGERLHFESSRKKEKEI